MTHMLNILACGSGTVVAMLLAASSASATPVTINTPFMNLENRGINSLGFSSGQFLRLGANAVTPNGDAGTIGVGTTTNLITNQIVTQTIRFDPGPSIPNFYSRYLADNSDLYGPWTLKFSNGLDSSQAIVSLPLGTGQAPFVNTITLSGTSANPTFSWTPPAGTLVNGYRVNIYDKALVSPTNNGQVASRNLTPNISSYTVDASDFTVPGYGFQLNRNYSIEIGLIQTKDKTSNNLTNGNLAAISRVYADFRPNTNGGPAVNLPVTLVDGSYQFNMVVTAGKTYYIDPPVAVGYDYRKAAGNPSFKSVVLPSGVGDDRFDIFALDAFNQTVLLAHDWLAGAVFDFGVAGVGAFRIGGIEATAGLDPANVTAFVTGVSFISDGLFTGTQTPIVLDVAAIPEPQTYALLLLGLGAVVYRSRKAFA
jgi:hypothetical protein